MGTVLPNLPATFQCASCRMKFTKDQAGCYGFVRHLVDAPDCLEFYLYDGRSYPPCKLQQAKLAQKRGSFHASRSLPGVCVLD